MTDWVRLWHDMPTDPKWRTIAKKSGQRIGDVIAVFNFMMVNASANSKQRGAMKSFDIEDVASALDLEETDVKAILSAMQGKVLDGDKLSGWERRQPKRDDDSTSRVAAYRERQASEKQKADELKIDDVTPCNALVTQCNAPETESETESDKKDVDDSASASAISENPEPDPEPPKIENSKKSKAELDDLENRLTEAASKSLSPVSAGLLVLSKPLAWLEAGCDLELDILPAIRAASARASPRSIKSWAYFEGAVMQALANRTAPIQKSEPQNANSGRSAKGENPLMAAIEKHKSRFAAEREGRDDGFGNSASVIELRAIATG